MCRLDAPESVFNICAGVRNVTARARGQALGGETRSNGHTSRDLRDDHARIRNQISQAVELRDLPLVPRLL